MNQSAVEGIPFVYVCCPNWRIHVGGVLTLSFLGGSLGTDSSGFYSF
jgi:hypothetical protein